MADLLEFQHTQEIHNLIDQDQEAKAIRYLQDLPENTPQEKRLIGHLRAQILMRKGKHAEALKLLQQLEKDFGKYIKIQQDITACFYLLGFMREYHNALREFKERYDFFSPYLSKRNKLRMGTCLAGYFEEEGEIAKAQDLYYDLLESMAQDEPAKEYYVLQAQLLRLKASFGLKKGIAPLYQDLQRLQKSHPSLYVGIEIQHSLLLAEYFLLDFKQVWKRWNTLEKEYPLSSSDKAWVLFDLLSMALKEIFSLPQALKEACQDINTQDPYELALLSLLNERPHELDLPSLAQKISPACYLRLLVLAGEKKTFQLLLENHTARDRQLLKNLMLDNPSVENEEITLTVDLNKKVISFRDEQLPLAKKKSLWELVLSAVGETPLELNSDNISLLEKYRVRAHRLSKLLFSLTGREKLISFSGESLNLHPKINFRLHA